MFGTVRSQRLPWVPYNEVFSFIMLINPRADV